ncbi:DUF2934 domain-containing protein [Tundrisphaera lichenicola]|uniref:DUF2934 domain-containing protein n=1 Tax=Tundrisphaera lichenicola TaxID=2029860 RepID=UPI003EBFCF42
MTTPSPQFDRLSASSERLGDLIDEEIAPLAHAIWEARGRPSCTDQEDWFEASRRLMESRGGKPSMTRDLAAEQAREARESREAQEAGPSIRDRMVTIGRGNQQAGRQGP